MQNQIIVTQLQGIHANVYLICDILFDLQLIGPQFVQAIRPSLQENNSWDSEHEDAWLNLFKFIVYVMKEVMATWNDIEASKLYTMII